MKSQIKMKKKKAPNNKLGVHLFFNSFFQNWMAFSKLHKPLFTEHGSVKFPNTNPPADENNNAYCKVRALSANVPVMMSLDARL